MRILILGAGAIGGYFGALLKDKGAAITLLVRQGQEAKLQSTGIRVESQLGNITAFPEVVSQIGSDNVYDLVIIACKTFALDDALVTLQHLNKSAYILPLLNGLSHYTKLQQFFSKERVLGGFAHLSTTRGENGTIIHMSTSQLLVIGKLHQVQNTFIQKLTAELAPIAPYIVFSEDIETAIWQKLIFISTAASATCLMNSTIGTISSLPAGASFISKSFELNCQAAAFAGYEPGKAWKKATLDELLNIESTMTASMLRDMRSAKPIELSILSDMLRRNEAAGLHNELLMLAYLKAQVYETDRIHSLIA